MLWPGDRVPDGTCESDEDTDVHLDPPRQEEQIYSDDDTGGDADEKGDDERAKDPNYLQHDKWFSATYQTGDGKTKKKYDFRTVTETVEEFTNEFYGYFYLLAQHHDLAKFFDAEYRNGSSTVKKGEVFCVINFSESHKHEARREHKSA